MSFERYIPFYNGYQSGGRTLRAGGEGTTFDFSLETSENRRYRLFVVGDTALYYQWKSEPGYPAHYHSIADALDSDHAFRAQYCLNLSSKEPKDYIRRIYKRVMWPPILYYMLLNPIPEDWTWGLWARAKNLRYEPGGYLRMRLDIYRTRKGVNRHDFSVPPDETAFIDFPEGSYDWTQFRRDLLVAARPDSGLAVSEDIARVGVWVEGAKYAGEFYIERPFLTASSGENLLPDFTTPATQRENFDWTAQYLSRKEWPEFRVTLNGRAVFEGEIFERCHVASEWSLDLPGQYLVCGANRLEIALISDYHDPLPYTVHEAGIIEQPGGEVALIAAQEAGVAGGKAHALIRTEAENTRVTFRFPDGRLSGKSEITFREKGLHGVAFDCGEACENAPFLMETARCTVRGAIPRIVEKQENRVVTGTGDMIYVPQRTDAVEEYLSWYVSNGVGSLLTVRPTYRWSSTRLLNPEAWRLVTRVLNELGMKYVHMVDGRELPGIATNPDKGMLAGDGFLGSQHHEWDGGAFYRGSGHFNSPSLEQQFDMQRRAWEEDPLHVPMGYRHDAHYYVGDVVYTDHDPAEPHDTRFAEEARIRQLAGSRGEVTRHTGPSFTFKYLLKAGFQWVGAETMYGPMEPLMAFLRGACLWKGLSSMGVHHAVQWSSSPQDAPEHFRRYRLALYVSYMQGATEINTEEGLWHLEEYYSHFHRFSAGCHGHLQQQQDFYRYVSTHSRTGEFFAPMAVLSGRHDGWHSFGRYEPWGLTGETNTAAEDSWDLLRAFYPLSKMSAALYIHGCDTDHPVGYYTGTPLGNVDALPVECETDQLKRYPVLAFLGYNCAETDDFERLTQYVKAGGTLILSRAHMTDTTSLADIAAGRLHYSENPLSFTDGAPSFRKTTVRGEEIEVCANALPPDEVIASADDGAPLAAKYRLGGGWVILFNANAWPSHPAIRALYEKELDKAMRALADSQNVWAECGNDVQFTVYDQPDGSRHVYLLAVDWYHDPAALRTGTLRVNGCRYDISMPFGVMIKAVSDGQRAAWPHDENGEVLRLTPRGAVVQGTGRVTFTLAEDGATRDVSADFTGGGTREISF